MILENSPREAKVWVYGFKEILNPQNKELVQTKLDSFILNWQYHGKPVNGDFEIVDDHFVILTTNDSISGCSIDSSVALFKELKNNHSLDALDQNLIFYRSSEGVNAVKRHEFQVLVSMDKITDSTKVFNLSVTSVGDVHNGDFELDFIESWHSQAFKRNIPARA